MARIGWLIAASLLLTLTPARAANVLPRASGEVVTAATMLPGQFGRPHPTVLPPSRFSDYTLERYREHSDLRHVARKHHKNVDVISDDSGYIFEITSRGKLVGYLDDCAGPEGSKIDHAGDLWVACTDAGAINMYEPGASTASLVLNATPKSSSIPFFPSDVAFDANGDVYAANLYAWSCNPSSCSYLPGNLVYWAQANVLPGAHPSGIVADANLDGETYFLDTDATGNVYVDYYGCAPQDIDCGYGLDGIANPQSPQPAVTQLDRADERAIEFPGRRLHDA